MSSTFILFQPLPRSPIQSCCRIARRRRAALEVVEPLAPFFRGAAAFLFTRAGRLQPVAVHQKESIEI
jgi:hypothetical protein